MQGNTRVYIFKRLLIKNCRLQEMMEEGNTVKTRKMKNFAEQHVPIISNLEKQDKTAAVVMAPLNSSLENISRNL